MALIRIKSLVEYEVRERVQTFSARLEELTSFSQGLGQDLQELRETLTTELLRLYSVTEEPREGSLSAQASQLAEDEAAHSVLVANSASGVIHAVLDAELSVAPQQGLARCQWPFTIGLNSRSVSSPPLTYKLLCERCFPMLRGWRKSRAALFPEGAA